MNSRLRPDAPELLALKKQLSIDTSVDECKLADWIRANLGWLNDFILCDIASDIAHLDHGDELYASLRIEFKRRTSVREPNTRPTPATSVIPAESPAQPRGLAAYLSRLIGRHA